MNSPIIAKTGGLGKIGKGPRLPQANSNPGFCFEFGRIPAQAPGRAIRLNKVLAGFRPPKLYTASIPCAEEFPAGCARRVKKPPPRFGRRLLPGAVRINPNRKHRRY
jgi:hypothetical protein